METVRLFGDRTGSESWPCGEHGRAPWPFPDCLVANQGESFWFAYLSPVSRLPKSQLWGWTDAQWLELFTALENTHMVVWYVCMYVRVCVLYVYVAYAREYLCVCV